MGDGAVDTGFLVLFYDDSQCTDPSSTDATSKYKSLVVPKNQGRRRSVYVLS